jgi:predicted PurR-regulated permease PerM
MKLTIHSTIVISSILAFVLISVVGLLSFTSQFENVLAQGQESGGPGQRGANQLMEDPQQSANQTMERAIQSANETGEDVAEVGSQVTEGTKDLIGNIGDKLEDLGK